MTTPTTSYPQQSDNPLAVAAMVCGALSLTGVGLLLGIPALILGIISLKRDGSGSSRNLSIAGIITGAISTLLTLLMISFLSWLLLWGGYDRVQQQQQVPAAPTYDSSKI